MHNCIYNTLGNLYESIKQLVKEEGLDITKEKIPTSYSLKKYLSKHDDYVGQLTNNTWYHIQFHPVFGA